MSRYACRVVTKKEKTIVASILRGAIRPRAAATQLALTATSMALEENELQVYGDEKKEKKMRYTKSRSYAKFKSRSIYRKLRATS